MNTLNETTVDTHVPALPDDREPAAVQFFARRDRLTSLCLLTTLAALLCAALCAVMALRASRQEPIIFTLDPAGTVFVGPGRTFDEAKELHTQQALLAATALLLRNPNGFDLPELLPDFFVGDALTQAVKLKTSEATEFQEKQIHQKPSVTRLEALEVGHQAIVMRISGELLRAGSFQQQTYLQVLPFTLNLSFKYNPDFLRNHRRPTVVTDFTLSYETPR